jgi:propionate CoA-transferase
MSPTFLRADDAVALIGDGATVANDGFTLLGVAEEVFEAIERRFLATGSPRGLTVVAASGQSGNAFGFEHFAHEGLVARVVGSHWGLQPAMSRFLGQDKAQAICLPQGQISALYRAIAAGRPGNLTTVGAGTFVDPDVDGGRINASARGAPDHVVAVHLDGERYLLYRTFPIDVGIVRATLVDEDGNCSMAEEAVTLDALPIAQAAHASGGIVIVQAKRLVPRGAIPPREVTIPAAFVDHVVVTSDPDRYHRQSLGFPLDRRLVSPGPVSDEPLGPRPPAERLAVGVRAVRDLRPGDVINIGTGIPGDVIGAALVEAGLAGRVTVTVESGIHGGAPLGGTDFGAAVHPDAIIPQGHQFDFYDGGGLDATFMGVGEVDRDGNVNVSLLGDRVIGCGGFIDITQSTRRIYFCFVMGGRHPKFVERVSHLTFSGAAARRSGQEVWYITERAVLRLVADGLELVEIAAGVDVERDVLAAIPFPVRVAPVLAAMEDGAAGRAHLGATSTPRRKDGP